MASDKSPLTNRQHAGPRGVLHLMCGSFNCWQLRKKYPKCQGLLHTINYEYIVNMLPGWSH